MGKGVPGLQKLKVMQYRPTIGSLPTIRDVRKTNTCNKERPAKIFITGASLKRKNLLPLGAFFPLREAPTLEAIIERFLDFKIILFWLRHDTVTPWGIRSMA